MKLIDVDATIQALNVASRGDSKDVIRNLVICFLLASPTVDAEPVRHGKWLKDPHSQNGFPSHIYMMRKCSECSHSVDNATPYCPWCGATMDRKGEE